MLGLGKRREKTPAQYKLERDISHAVGRLGKWYGREAVHRLVLGLAAALNDPQHPLSQTVDELHGKVKGETE